MPGFHSEQCVTLLTCLHIISSVEHVCNALAQVCLDRRGGCAADLPAAEAQHDRARVRGRGIHHHVQVTHTLRNICNFRDKEIVLII